ncbi:MAG: SLOG family protein [Rikenellaceae bacterium]
MDIKKSVSFSGYRPEKMPDKGDEQSTSIAVLKSDLKQSILQAIKDGFTTFIVGMAEGFDTYAALEVIKLKLSGNDIKLMCAIPYDNGNVRGETHQYILENADERVVLSDTNNRGVYYTRNEYMVDNSARLICYYDGLAGGTEYTIDYANKKGVEVINLAPQKTSIPNMPEMFDNIMKTVRDDLDRSIKKGSKVSIAGACFSIYAYNELKKRLNSIDELKFIFTSPTFITDKIAKEKREFYIPRLTREKNLYGTEFEVKLRNELTQKAIAKECAKWIEKKVTFKSNITTENMAKFISLENQEDSSVYLPIDGFTTVDIGCERGNNMSNFVHKMGYPASSTYLSTFDEIWNDKNKLQDVTNEVLNSISSVYKENSAEFIYFVTLYNIFSEFLEDISEDVLPNEATGFKESKVWNMLYNFQKDAVLAIINKLEKYNGCILADSVGLGKTFTSLAVVKYYENRNKSVLVLCPKKLANNWNTYKDNYVNNPLATDRLRYDVLYHTDLSRTRGTSNGLDLDRLNWGNYDLVVIDESHNFRNGGKLGADEDEKQNRYIKLLNNVIRKGVKTKVLMLSATPVNNKFTDLKNQLQLAYEGDSSLINSKLNTNRSIEDVFKYAQTAFNNWTKMEPEQRTTDTLLKMLDFDFFEVLDSVTIARSRKHIEKYYDTSDIGKFPTRLKPLSYRPPLTDLKSAINYNEIFEQLTLLNLSIYTPSHYILESKLDKYAEIFGDDKVNIGFTQANREQGIKRLTAINLMKRMESSVYSFNLTLSRIRDLIDDTIAIINDFKSSKNTTLNLVDITNIADFDDDDLNTEDVFSIGKKVRIDLGDMDYLSWQSRLKEDSTILELLTTMVADITPEHDSKLQMLFDVMEKKIQTPINGTNKKIIVFTAFADTATYLYDHISTRFKSKYDLNSAMVTGSVDAKTTVPKLKSDLNTTLTLFSPISKSKKLLLPNDKNEIDILIATDCISEGQNLQDCDYLINYDIHWNPVRIIQRFGRVDRIGSQNEFIQLVNFWPDLDLDEYINLKARVETKMKITVMTSTGDDNLISPEEKGDLEYRKKQLEKLHEEVVDIEEMSSGINIMDLGLNEFRLDLLAYVKENGDLDKVPFGMHAVAAASEDAPRGVVYVLKNRSDSVNIDNQNRLHPFYMVYLKEDGTVVCDHLSPKNMLDKMRLICKGKNVEDVKLCNEFNSVTRDGRDMSEFSRLLGDAISSIIEVKEESDIDSFLGGGDFSFKSNVIKGLDDFELICFLVVS